MLSKSDIPPSHILPRFTTHGLEVAFLVPTPTGLGKSILDAVGALRELLLRKGFHDFSAQAQADKVLRKAHFVHVDRLEATTVSLYRPQTKTGDPRIWPYGLPDYARPFNLLAILCENDELYIINASDKGILDSIDDPRSPLGRLARKGDQLEPAASELLEMLRAISRKGFVPSLRRGDTGVGFTLETLLGIPANTSRTPDFKGIEIKASRRIGGVAQGNRVTLFSQVPDWKRSTLKNGREILKNYGYERAGRLQLYCTVGASPNSQGLYFELDDDLVCNKARLPSGNVDVACWPASSLTNRLLEKHPSTMWIKARCRGERAAGEEFHYIEAIYTRNPLAANLLPLIDIGTVTMDYTLSLRDTGSARDHGYLFKIFPDDLPSLFPPPRKFLLTS